MATIRRRGRSIAGQIFYAAVFATLITAFFGFVSPIKRHTEEPSGLSLIRRDDLVPTLQRRDADCRSVHSAPDQCAFIKANCPYEEIGLLSYLDLYYCRLPNVKPLAFIILLSWLGILFSTIGIAASDFLCINLSTISSLLGMSESLAGVTFLAFGNGSPDVFSTFAAMGSHSGSLAIGELIGAACFISAVVAGSMAIVRPFKVARKSFIRDVSFFAIAAAFSMVFLADGHLHLWECAVMVGFYVFYVIFVVTWDWYQKRTRRRKTREAAARSEFHIPSRQELEINVTIDDEDMPTAGETDPLLRQGSMDEFVALEAANLQWLDEEFDEDDEAKSRSLAELQNQMRIKRPRGQRKNTMTIRPSLVGALGFRSALSQEGRGKGRFDMPLNWRRYSDQTSAVSDGIATPRGEHTVQLHHQRRPSENILSSGQHKAQPSGRNRAVSANDALGLRLDTSVLRDQTKQKIDLLAIPSEDSPSNSPRDHDPGGIHETVIPSSGETTPRGPRARSPHLMPPEENFRNPVYQNPHSHVVESPAESPKSVGRPSKPRTHSPLSQSPVSPFPPYSDSPNSLSRAPSIHLPSPGLPDENPELPAFHENSSEIRIISWWPYNYLPPPQTLFSVLFPTLYHWRSKILYDKLLGLFTAPSVFLLTITLPVIEDKETKADPDPGLLSPRPDFGVSTPRSVQDGEASTPQPNGSSVGSKTPNEPEPLSSDSFDTSPREWNRWLVCVQIFTAPLFIICIVWANMDARHSRLTLLYMSLASIGFSLLCLTAFLVLTRSSDPNKPPKYRPLLCFLGFFVAISWIATIANEVVGVLKAFGVILGISDAILGLTIFAVGNSLGDLVADITVARLGFPMMALSACFGGPMLNILLGIGVSGLYITIRRGESKHEKHPDRPIVYKPYSIEVSTTLIISGVTLLVTLIGLLIVVPLNRWKMDRKIGWGLIALWTASTIGNVIVEVLGVGENI